ncbi:MAG: hypothetical protein A2019_03720 [Sulfurimonas sp. GWF2_37_8]|nr:MAG: hypothetical protein A2019_03720 [Sulfurimonas sp. GWF2_37_8]
MKLCCSIVLLSSSLLFAGCSDCSEKNFIGNFACDGQLSVKIEEGGRGYIQNVPIKWNFQNNYLLIDVPANKNLTSELKKIKTKENYFELITVKSGEKMECMILTKDSIQDNLIPGILKGK